MKPNTLLNRVPRDQLPPHLQKAWDSSNALHGDTTFVEVAGNNPMMYDWYLQDFYDKELRTAPLSTFQRSYTFVLAHGIDVVNADMSSFAHLEENVAAAVGSTTYFA